MPDYNEISRASATVEAGNPAARQIINKTPLDYFALAVTTFGVGYLPVAPGTYGSMVGVVIYLLFGWLENNAAVNFGANGWTTAQITAWVHVVNLILFTFFCLLGVWAANRATVLFGKKDPQQAVVDEVIGQLIVFLFVPFDTHWYFVLAGFLLFRLFDIWKPYPIRLLENLPAGLGVCADDMLAGVYGGICLTIIYAVSLML